MEALIEECSGNEMQLDAYVNFTLYLVRRARDKKNIFRRRTGDYPHVGYLIADEACP
jgi:hypothetical protein